MNNHIDILLKFSYIKFSYIEQTLDISNRHFTTDMLIKAILPLVMLSYCERTFRIVRLNW